MIQAHCTVRSQANPHIKPALFSQSFAWPDAGVPSTKGRSSLSSTHDPDWSAPSWTSRVSLREKGIRLLLRNSHDVYVHTHVRACKHIYRSVESNSALRYIYVCIPPEACRCASHTRTSEHTRESNRLDACESVQTSAHSACSHTAQSKVINKHKN